MKFMFLKLFYFVTGSKAETIEDVLNGEDKLVMEGIQRGIDRYNARATSNAQRIQKWTILPADFSIPGGEIGPTMKVRIFVVVVLAIVFSCIWMKYSYRM